MFKIEFSELLLVFVISPATLGPERLLVLLRIILILARSLRSLEDSA